MMLWRLRRALNDPLPGSEWRGYLLLSRMHHAPPVEPLPVIVVLTSLLRGVGLVILPLGLVLFGAPMLIVVLFLLFTLSPLLVPLANLLHGIDIAFHVSGNIAREREKSRYDLFNTLPPGTVGLHWMYTVRWLLDHPRFRKLALFMVFIGGIAAVFGMAALFTRAADGHVSTPAWLLSILCVVALIAFDYTASQITAALIAMIFPAHTANVTSARFAAIGMFVTMQLAAYLVGVLCASVILPAFYRLIGASDPLIAFTLPVITLLVFIGVREFIVRRLWAALRRAVNATPAEMEALC